MLIFAFRHLISTPQQSGADGDTGNSGTSATEEVKQVAKMCIRDRKKLGIMLIVSGMLMSMLTACGGSKTAAADDTKRCV